MLDWFYDLFRTPEQRAMIDMARTMALVSDMNEITCTKPQSEITKKEQKRLDEINKKLEKRGREMGLKFVS